MSVLKGSINQNEMGKLKETAIEIIKRIREHGHLAYMAGGCVRDMLMGNEPYDYDIATSARPEQIMGLFEKTIPVGAKFGVVNVIFDNSQFEVATFRSDGPYSDSRRPDIITFCDAKGDVLRRDFTINGMLYDPVEARVIDYVGGERDIKAHLIRTIGEPRKRFDEDHLRLIRAVRFAARFSYDIEHETGMAIKNLSQKILSVSVERIREELEKGLTGQNPHNFIRLLDETDLLRQILPEIAQMKGVEQPENFHPEGDVFVHTLIALSKLNQPSWELAMGTLLHDVAKPATFSRDIDPSRESGKIRFTRHEIIGAEMAGLICERLKTSTYTRERVMWLVKKHLCFKDVQRMRKSTLKRLFAHPGYPELLEVFRVDTLASTKDMTDYEYCRKISEEMSEEEVKPRPLINGYDLIAMGLKPGPIFSEILTQVMDEQLEEKIFTKEEALALAKRLIQETEERGQKRVDSG